MKNELTNIYLKLQEARFIVLGKLGKKSGKNSFVGFEYFELKDFVPQAIEAFREVGITSVFNIDPARKVVEDGVITEYPETASMTITDGKESIEFHIPTADATGKGQLPIQALGSKQTYLRRYLYLSALDIVENDSVDAMSNEQKDVQPKKTAGPTAEQIKIIKSSLSEDAIKTMLAKVNKNAVEELSVKEASDICNWIRSKQNGTDKGNE